MTDRMVLTEDEAYELLAHLVASAEICTFEPYYYGSFRLIDAASRLMGHMLGRGDPERDGWLRDLREEIDRDAGLHRRAGRRRGRAHGGGGRAVGLQRG